MSYSINEIPRPVRRRLKRLMQKAKDIKHARRANAILLLHQGLTNSEVARHLHAARSSLQNWRKRFEQFGEAGLVPERPGRKSGTVTEEVCHHLCLLIDETPNAYGYLRSRWTSEMLAEQVFVDLDIKIHASTIRRLLPSLGIQWNRARPGLCIPDPRKSAKMKAITRALNAASEQTPVFYVDEVDIDFNPKIGNSWMKKGNQTTIPTPGKNQKRYLAGALNATTGNVIWVEWEKKNSDIFILLLAELRKRYRKAKKITVVADNYVIHKSAMTKCFLRCNDKFKLLFQPVYHPWVNKIELMWKQLHEAITRNHKFPTMNTLMKAVRTFMRHASPFPGSRVNMARV